MAWNPRDHDPEWPFEHQETPFALDAATTALLVIDIQQSQIAQDPDGDLARGPAGRRRAVHGGVQTYWPWPSRP